MPHRLPGRPRRGRLLERPNRFVGVVALDDGPTVRAHIADRGRLADILFPGNEVFVVEREEPGRTACSLVLARAPSLGGPRPLVPLDPAGANRLVRRLVEDGALGLPPYERLRAEVAHGSSRFDFLLELPGGVRHWLEVKSCAAASGQAALFPDAPSERAARHCRELAALVRAGDRAAIVLVALRADVAEIRPHPVDPAFAGALAAARDAGVRLVGAAFEVGLDGFRYRGTRPVHVTPA